MSEEEESSKVSESPSRISNDEEPSTISELPANLVSEFFVTIMGRIIPGGIFAFLYFDHTALNSGAIPASFLALCIAWFIGSAIDIASNSVADLVWRVPEIFGEKPTESGYPFLVDSKLATPTRRRYNFYNAETILFRCMAVVCLFVSAFHPLYWPFPKYQYNDPVHWLNLSSIPHLSWLSWGHFLGIAGLMICLVCWGKMRCVLSKAQKHPPTRERA